MKIELRSSNCITEGWGGVNITSIETPIIIKLDYSHKIRIRTDGRQKGRKEGRKSKELSFPV